jgi:hypothetical protein
MRLPFWAGARVEAGCLPLAVNTIFARRKTPDEEADAAHQKRLRALKPVTSGNSKSITFPQPL